MEATKEFVDHVILGSHSAKSYIIVEKEMKYQLHCIINRFALLHEIDVYYSYCSILSKENQKSLKPSGFSFFPSLRKTLNCMALSFFFCISRRLF